MEELSIEEKAKLYDKAIERANLYLGGNQLGDAWIYKLLPELENEENKDEGIRKALIKSFKELLKQNEATWGSDIKFKYVKVKDAITYLEKQGKNISPLKFTFDDVLALQFAMAIVKNEQKDKDLYEQLESLHERIHDAYWLEKKPVDLVTILKNYFANTPKEQQEKDWAELKLLNNVGLDAEIALGAKDSEQKPTDKYEPMSLDEAIEHCKEKSCGNNTCALEHKQLEKWLTELKELKEKKPWSEEDEEIYRRCICSMKASACGFPEEEKFVEKVDNWLKELKNRVGCEANCTTIQEWSDEDENYFNAIISVIKENKSLLKLDDWDITWLRLLKYRVQAQPKQQWSKEDEMQFDAAISIIVDSGHLCTANWLESFKDKILLYGDECYNPYKEAIESIIEMCQRYDKLNLLDSFQDFYNNVKVKCKDAKEYDSLNS